MAVNANYDALLTTTLANHMSTLEDNVFTARALTAWLKRKDKIKMKSGGHKIVVPLIHGTNDTVGTYAGYDTILTTPQEGISAAEYTWQQYAGSVAIAGIEEAKNNGDQAVIDLLEAKVMQTTESIAEAWDVMFFADGSATNAWNGLGNIVASSPSTGIVGGINRATAGNTFWRNYAEATSAVLTLAYMTTAYNTVSKGNDHPDFGITTQTLFEKYEALLQPQLRLTDNKTADGGFQNLLFKDMPVMFDTNCTATNMYFLNSKYLYLIGHSQNWFRNTPFQTPPNQDARYALILVYGNLVASNCSRQGVLSGKTAV